ncbi:MAG TPA: PQQ-binding-like beta-propeller repeat protein [Kofleriaceae bacterium]
MILDAALHETHRFDTSVQPIVAVAPDDAIYAVVPPSPQDAAAVFALSPAGKERWRTSIASDLYVRRIVASTEGPYIETASTIVGFDAATGESRMRAGGQRLLAAAHDGVFTVASESQQSLTLSHLDRDGTPVWSHGISSPGYVSLSGAAATADGGVVAFGNGWSTVDFGDRILDHVSEEFVVGFDAAGATQWAFKHVGYSGAGFRTSDIAVAAQGEILLIGNASGQFMRHSDAHLDVATPAGDVREIKFTGPGDQQIWYVGARPDGTAVVQVSNFRSPLLNEKQGMIIGDRGFADPGVYLFELAL